MSAKKFNFVSPGIFLNEIDNSNIDKQSDAVGPVVVGRLKKGPAMRPVKVQSYADFVETFGTPEAGGRGGDVWRNGNTTAPTYAAYAAQAWLRNSAPITVVRLLGEQHSNAVSAGKAGWDSGDVKEDVDGGAYGLFLFNTAHTGGHNSAAPATGVLAAVFYNKGGANTVGLTASAGSSFAHDTTLGGEVGLGTGTATMISASSGYFYMKISSSLNADRRYKFNFDRNGDFYIRKVFNTNPTLTNTTVTATGSREYYWLGETYDRFIEGCDTVGNNPLTGSSTFDAAMLIGLRDAVTQTDWADRNFAAKNSKTGWFVSQDLGNAETFDATQMQKLFRLLSRDSGEWNQNNLKVSIMDIKPSSNNLDDYGSFTVAIRKLSDQDNAPVYIERFTGCTLNPNSENYVARKIGDRYTTWNETEKRYKYHGRFDNASRYIRADMNVDVDKGSTDARYLPFGFYGPRKIKDTTALSGATSNLAAGDTFTSGGYKHALGTTFNGYHFTASFTQVKNGATTDNVSGTLNITASFHFPTIALRHDGLQGNVNSPQTAFWGVDLNESGSVRFDKSNLDILRVLPAEVEGAGTHDEDSYVFTLDHLSSSNDGKGAYYQSGSRFNGVNGPGTSAASQSITGRDGWSSMLENQKYNRFTTVMWGGHDGLNVTEREPFRNSLISGKTEINNYAHYSIKKAIDTLADPEQAEFNLALIPGLTDTTLTEHLIRTCENRADALAIIDLPDDYTPGTENTSDDSENVGTVSGAVSNLRGRGLNTSYGCAYYPWVLGRDSESNSIVWLPPSVAALGTMAHSERQQALWFAPAGFTRGGITNGAAGIPIIGVRQVLSSRDRDRLYDANINPIATFPNEGIVVFGQKTLQVTRSALDRINVRRLLIHVKKEMSRIAATTLFEPNIELTWTRFKSRADDFLEGVRSGFGLDDYKVVLDKSTTTDELIDRNIMYAKIFLKPTKAIEFIALDFIVTDSGASFED